MMKNHKFADDIIADENHHLGNQLDHDFINSKHVDPHKEDQLL